MKTKLFYFTLLFCGILMTSCQKEELVDLSPTDTQSSTEALAIQSDSSTDPVQNSEGKKAPQCSTIHLFTQTMTVSHDDFQNIENTLLFTGISLLAPGCNEYYHQNSNIFPGWTQKVQNAIDVISIGDEDITFRVNNLNHVCYGCLFNSFCNFNNSTIHVILGNDCVMGQFVLNTSSDQFVEIDLSPILNATCTALC